MNTTDYKWNYKDQNLKNKPFMLYIHKHNELQII